MSRKFDAKLFTNLPSVKKDVIGHSLSGYIFEDKHTHGHHPFKDQTYIYTSTVQDVVEEDGQTFIITRNTTYLFLDAEGASFLTRTGDPMSKSEAGL